MSSQSDDAAAKALLQQNEFVWVGTHVTSMLYSVFLASTLINIHFLWKRRNTAKVLLAYSFITLITSTVYYGNGINEQQLEVIAGGRPSVGQVATQGTFSFLNQLLADSVLIYRCYIVWNRNKVILALSLLGYIGMMGTEIGSLVLFLRPGNDYSTKDVQNILLSTLSISLGLNIILPLLIASRMLYYRKQLRDALSSSGVQQYSSVAAVVIESASVYGVVAFITIVVYAINDPSFAFFSSFIYMMPTLAASWIIYRVATGAAITSTHITAATSGSMVFATVQETTEGSRSYTTRAGSEPGLVESKKYKSNSSLEKGSSRV